MRGKKRSKNTLKFEECIEQIDQEIRKRRNKWNLTAISWMDFDDVSQILRIHIYKKWDLYDPSKPLCPWLNRIISNQIKNSIRNNYGNYTRPCLRCAAAEGENLCAIYEKQTNECPMYSNWEKHKKMAYNAKLPVSLENHSQEVYNKFNESVDIEKAIIVFNKKMEEILKPVEWKVYSLLYIENLSESQAAKRMGYKTNEQNRSPGYKQIKNLKKAIIKKAREFLKDGDVDFL